MLLCIIFSLTFPIHERLNYGGFYGPLRVGSSFMEIKEGKLNGEPVYIIQSLQKTEGIFSWFFGIDDYYCSYVDTASFSSIRFIKDIKEGKYKKKSTLNFTQDSVHYSSGKRTKKIPGAKDIFASLYWMRNLSFSSGDTLRIPFHSSGKNHEMLVPISGPYWIKVPMGKFETYLLTPGVEGGRIFGSSDPIKIWVSLDSTHLPVKIKSNLSFGSISFVLESREIGEERK
ncbi:MAG: DUF3108 domain-containing protein [candidate division WOR-3 bacterium]|nr:DUF3108 domain-containing protein [candidate division WOR-3 bacterium]